ncbi:bacterial Ig-like domain protein [Histomonas meleagridis]|uniref:bacterial Ig-like domain protein n=1 Tax=Histomonas meleagridis TaxID=135588 RepID=UPI0035597D83|nr:bacterial Ig-like domain protein [Histomonas meleagridis]
MSFATDPNGQEYIYPKSASLKSWMEGGTVDGINYSPIGIDINTNQQLMNITLKSIDEFEVTIRENPSWIYQFDVIVHGFWDANANFSLSTNSSNTTIRDYIDRGYGFIAGHDILCLAFVKDKIEPTSLIAIRDLFGIKLQPIDDGTFFTIYSTNISIQKRGNILKYPWDIDGEINTTYDIYNTHTTSNAAIGDVWFSLGNTGVQLDGELKHNFYLTTYNNTAMIQLGHSECNATETEMKILANTIFYLKQRTTEEEFDDYLFSNDVVPPKIENIKFDENNYSVKIYAEDYGSEYTYKVCAYNESGDLVDESNNETVNVVTGVTGYKYIINENEKCNISELINETFDDYIYITNNDIVKQMYVHVAAVDGAGNIGEVKSFPIPNMSTKTFSKSNTYTQSNTFSCSSTYTQSNTFSCSSTFTDSFNSDITFSYSMILKSFMSVTETITMISHITFSCNSQEATYSMLIYYSYSVLLYSSYYVEYSAFYTMFHSNETISDGISIYVLIAIICCSVIVLLIIIGIIIFVVRKAEKEEHQSSENSEIQNEEPKFTDGTIEKDIKTLILNDNDQWL